MNTKKLKKLCSCLPRQIQLEDPKMASHVDNYLGVISFFEIRVFTWSLKRCNHYLFEDNLI